MAATRLVIDSRLRDTGTVEDYTYELQSPLRNVTGVSLGAFSLPKSSYPVLTGFNDSINFDYNSAGPYVATLTSQFYTGPQLATEIASALNTAASTADFAATFDSQTSKITVTTTTNNFDINSQTTTPQVTQLTGFESTASGVMTYTGDYTVNTSWPLYLLVDIDFGTSQGFGQSTWAKENSYTLVVPYGEASSNEFAYYTRDSVTPQVQAVTDLNVQKIRVRLRPPDTATGTTAPPANWSLNNVDHILVLDIAQMF